MHPLAPLLREAAGEQDAEQGGPIDRIEGLGKVQFEHNCRDLPFVTTLHKFSRKDKVFSDRPPPNETGLIQRDNLGDFTL